jgi:hypothetical protein
MADAWLFSGHQCHTDSAPPWCSRFLIVFSNTCLSSAVHESYLRLRTLGDDADSSIRANLR